MAALTTAVQPILVRPLEISITDSFLWPQSHFSCVQYVLFCTTVSGLTTWYEPVDLLFFIYIYNIFTFFFVAFLVFSTTVKLEGTAVLLKINLKNRTDIWGSQVAGPVQMGISLCLNHRGATPPVTDKNPYLNL